MSWGYGRYDYFCEHIPSVATCNLFFRQFYGNNQADSGVGIDPICAIPNIGASNSIGNVANMIVCGLSVLVALGIAVAAVRRIAAVGRVEFASLSLWYALSCVLQLFSEGSFLRQGSTALVWLTAVHEGVVASLFRKLLWTALLTLQFLEDGRPASYLALVLPTLVLLIATTYISLDTAFGVTSYFETTPENQQNAWLFSLTIIWPAVAILAYYVINIVVIQRVLRETKPLILFTATLVLFALSQAARYALSQTICTGTNAKIDGSFLGTLLETATLVLLYLSHKAITEDQFDDYSWA